MSYAASFARVVDEKQAHIKKSMKRAKPTVVFSCPSGIVVCAEHVEKLNATMVCAGAGTSFLPIAEYLRGEVRALEVQWAKNVPRAKSEVQLLPRIFAVNNFASGEAVHADVVLIEIGATPEQDDIFRVDFRGRVTKYDGGVPLLVSYRAQAEGDDDENEDEESPKRARAFQKDFERATGASSLESLVPNEALEHIKGFFEEKGFLDRAAFSAKKFHWVYREL